MGRQAKKLRSLRESLKPQNRLIIGADNGGLGERFWCNSSGVGYVLFCSVIIIVSKRCKFHDIK